MLAVTYLLDPHPADFFFGKNKSMGMNMIANLHFLCLKEMGMNMIANLHFLCLKEMAGTSFNSNSGFFSKKRKEKAQIQIKMRLKSDVSYFRPFYLFLDQIEINRIHNLAYLSYPSTSTTVLANY